MLSYKEKSFRQSDKECRSFYVNMSYYLDSIRVRCEELFAYRSQEARVGQDLGHQQQSAKHNMIGFKAIHEKQRKKHISGSNKYSERSISRDLRTVNTNRCYI